MLKFLFFSALVVAAVTLGAPIFFPLLIVFSLIWLITLPIRLVFGLTAVVMKLIFGIIGAVFSIVFAPFVLMFMLLWGIVRLVTPRRRYTTA
ncbi:MAG TPA: hypothetical protein VFD21_21885 [Vicinamibacterales bacterium]|jgi:hypothetical protein|nr:hypothetical protein [Vicinamibacterales bacterium]